MKRLFWLGVGLAVGALVVRAVTKKASSFTPKGIAVAVRDSGRNAFDSVRDFVDDVRDGMHEREEELLVALDSGQSLADLDEDPGDLSEFSDDDLDEFEAALDRLEAAEGTNR